MPTAPCRGSNRCRQGRHRTISRTLGATAWPRASSGMKLAGRCVRRGLQSRAMFSPIVFAVFVSYLGALQQHLRGVAAVKLHHVESDLLKGVFVAFHARLTAPRASHLRQDRARQRLVGRGGHWRGLTGTGDSPSLFCQCPRFPQSAADERAEWPGGRLLPSRLPDHFADDHAVSKMWGTANCGHQFAFRDTTHCRGSGAPCFRE